MSSATAPAHGWVPTPSTSFGDRLYELRRRAGYRTIKDAATACGIKEQTWINWETYGRLPQRYDEACRKISAASGCDYWWLAGGTEAVHNRSKKTPRISVQHQHQRVLVPA